MEESKLLLPGGSQVEGFEVDQRGARRHRRAAVMAICAVAGVACVAAASVSRSAQTELLAIAKGAAKAVPTAQLRQVPSDKADAYLAKHGIPSWLSTSDVKLKPLSAMIHEQLAVKAMQTAAQDKKLEKEETKSSHEPSPRELAMKNALHSQATKKVAAKSAKVTIATSTQSLTQVSEPVQPSAPAATKYHAGAIKTMEKALSKAKKGLSDEELVVENSEKQKLEAIRKEEEHVNKEEVHRLAKIKKSSLKQQEKIEKQITTLKAEKAAEQLSEKKMIKAQMAKIEDEEREKLADLTKKMTLIAKGQVLQDVAPKAAKAAKPEADEHAATKARGHTVVQKAAVKVQTDSDAAATGDKKTAKAATGTKSLKLKAVVLKKSKAICTSTKCDLAEEDKQWGEIGGKVDDYAKEAAQAHGKAKQAALAHMQYLQAQIEKDYKHVTGFAVAQEHALPPAPKMH